MLADIAALCGHVRDGEPVIQFVLAGGSAFEEKLAHPRLESLQQRMAARCYLQSLSYDETVSYIKAQVEFCGGQLDQVIAPERGECALPCFGWRAAADQPGWRSCAAFVLPGEAASGDEGGD